MVKDLVIHIGDPKTGSSAIQTALHQGACSCETVTFVSQPEVNASKLALTLQPRPENAVQKAKARERLFRERAAWAQAHDADLGILSAEFFAGAEPQRLEETLREFMPQYVDNVRIIAYVRPHAGRILSGYAQELKVGSYLGQLDEFVPVAHRKRMHKYASRFAKWQEVFGSRFTLRPFVREKLRRNDVVEDFFHTLLHGAEFHLNPVKDVNQSLALEELAAMRFLQGLFVGHDIPPFLRLALGAATARILTAQSNRYRSKLRLDRHNAERIRSLFLEDAKEMDAHFWNEPLMVSDLDSAVEKAISTPRMQPIQAEVYYSAGQLAHLEQLAEAIAGLLKVRRFAWYHEHLRRSSMRFDCLEDEPNHEQKRKNADQVWALLDEIVALLVPGQEERAAG
jgi:hypothetical protein